MTEPPTGEATDQAGSNDGTRPTLTRRGYARAIGASAASTVALSQVGASDPVGKTVTLDNVWAESPSSPIAPDDGFADLDWLEAHEFRVVRVTNLDAGGPGSFKYACEEVDGPRLVVFEVGGEIDMEGGDVQAEEKHLYVAGQTAPDPGITITRTNKPGVEFDEENMFVQHLRSRPGDDVDHGEPADAMVVGDNAWNVCFDHCSATWGTEENMSVNADDETEAITFSNNVIAEGLFDSPIHGGDDQRAYGTLFGTDGDTGAILGNVYANNWSRNARLKGGTETVLANNVFHNVERHTRTGGDSDRDTIVHAVGNHYSPGPAADFDRPVLYTEDDDQLLYYDDLVLEGDWDAIDEDDGWELLEEPIDEYWPGQFDPIAGDAVFDAITATAGARPAARTHHDERILQTVHDGTGQIIDSQDEVGGYPDLEPTERELDVPDGNVTDWLWEHTVAVEVAEDADPCPADATAATVGDRTVCDLNGDGNYRDVTASGDVTTQDLQQFFEHQHTDPWNDRTDLFDFTGNGDVGQPDVVDLFHSL